MLSEAQAELSQAKLDFTQEMDKLVKSKLADMMSRGMKISGLEAKLRKATSDLNKTTLLLDESRSAEEAAVKRAALTDLTITQLQRQVNELQTKLGLKL